MGTNPKRAAPVKSVPLKRGKIRNLQPPPKRAAPKMRQNYWGWVFELLKFIYTIEYRRYIYNAPEYFPRLHRNKTLS